MYSAQAERIKILRETQYIENMKRHTIQLVTLVHGSFHK